MVRTKTPAKSRDTRFGAKSPSSSGEGTSFENNPSDASHSKFSHSNRKGNPRKFSSASRTKVFVQTTTKVVEKSGKHKLIKSKVLKDIKFLQSTVHTLIPKLPFSRVVREILQNGKPDDISISLIALEAIQEAAELYLTCLFADSNILARHAKRVTIQPIDMALVLNLRQHS